MLAMILAAALSADPAGEPIVGVAITQANGEDFPSALEAARVAGMRSVSLPLKWSDVEVTPGRFAPDPDWLAVAAASYPQFGVHCCLELNPIDTNTVCVPEDLAGKAWDDPAVIRRYLAALDWVLDHTGELSVPSLALGNEVDGSLATAVEVAAYARLVRAAREHVARRNPEMLCGAKITYGGLTGPLQDELLKLVGEGNVSLVTYYPLRPDFTVRPPNVVEGELTALLEALPAGPVQFAEIGYPSGAACGSSPQKQAEFVGEAFDFWRRNDDRVGLMMFTWLSDISETEAREYAGYYRIPNPAFEAYLATLGLRTHGGRPKPAYKRLKAEAARGL